jgi:hypothetical protein
MAVSVPFVRRLLLCAIGVLALSACGDDSVQSPAANAPAITAPAITAPAVTAPATTVVPASLAFTAPLVGGGSIDLAQYAATPVLMWFWAPLESPVTTKPLRSKRQSSGGPARCSSSASPGTATINPSRIRRQVRAHLPADQRQRRQGVRSIRCAVSAGDGGHRQSRRRSGLVGCRRGRCLDEPFRQPSTPDCGARRRSRTPRLV